MCAKGTMWALAVLALTGTATAQQRVPYVCQDVKKAPPQCARYYDSVSRHGEIREAPKAGSRRTSNPPQDPEWSRTRDRARDELFNEGRDTFVDALPETPTGKAIKKGYKYGNAVNDPAGYVVDKGLERTFRKELAEKLGKRFINPGMTAVDIITEPIPNPKGSRQGSSRRPGNEYSAGLAYDALEKGRCLPRHMLVPSGPTLRAGPAGGIAPSRPVPSRIPDNCASVSELTAYVNQYQREFDEIAAQERGEWERQPWHQPFDSRDLDGLIRYAEQLMKDPSVPPDLRVQLGDALSEMRAERKRQGGFIPSPSSSEPLTNDPIRDAWQRMDGNMSIKPWR